MHTKKIVIIAMLIAMEIVLTRMLFFQASPFARYSLGFAPLALIAMLYGPLFGGLAAALSDVLGFFLFPPPFSFFPGFTLSAFLIGAIYGLFLHKPPVKTWRVVVAALIVVICVQLALDSFWLTLLFDTGFIVMLPERLIRTAIMLPVQIICIRFLTGERFRVILQKTA